MPHKFVKATFELYCDWEGLAPNYRVYVNDELFVERTYLWTDAYLEEMLQIQAPPGVYKIRIEKVKPCLAKYRMGDKKIEVGPARWLDNETLEILE